MFESTIMYSDIGILVHCWRKFVYCWSN